MFSLPDIGVISILALLLFGPDRLPGMLRQAGRIMREVQNTSHSFVAEMERAADVQERPEPRVDEPLIPPHPEPVAESPEPHVESLEPPAPERPNG
ncbi:MAG TPA: twin-arginine translocase TatA/TatE family subunit [Verrucomicrobiae bacterium]|jgi:Sec-independent protein translocase protein TatA|nr:twin-arginine translocase TatA/TatE family subunit [Verrucomicrobiae bacterium]